MYVRSEPFPVLLGERRGVKRYLEPMAPNRWCGQEDCVVGPFSSREVAENFASRRVTFGQFEVYRFDIFAQGDGWYVEVVSAQRIAF